MNITDYQILIANLPVRQQSFTTQKATWLKFEENNEYLRAFNDNHFKGNKDLCLSRQDLFDINHSTRELILKTIYWGYIRGMRGNHFPNIIEKISSLESALVKLKQNENLSAIDFKDFIENKISGIGLSTLSKLLYFLDIKFNGHTALILDQRLIVTFQNKHYKEFYDLSKIKYENAQKYYLDYLEITNNLAIEMKTKGENIEQFLFMFSNNLKKYGK